MIFLALKIFLQCLTNLAQKSENCNKFSSVFNHLLWRQPPHRHLFRSLAVVFCCWGRTHRSSSASRTRWRCQSCWSHPQNQPSHRWERERSADRRWGLHSPTAQSTAMGCNLGGGWSQVLSLWRKDGNSTCTPLLNATYSQMESWRWNPKPSWCYFWLFCSIHMKIHPEGKRIILKIRLSAELWLIKVCSVPLMCFCSQSFPCEILKK